ncbi:MAG: phage tail tip fiber protein [Aeromonas veronii]
MGLTVGAIATIVSAAASVVSLAMTLSMKPTNPAEAKDSGSSIDRKGQNNPKIVPFGRCMVPTARVWNNVNNANTKYLAQVYSMGIGPLKSIEQVYIDGVNYFGDHEQPVANHWYGMRHSGEYPNVMMGLRLGQPSETVHGELIGHSDGEWTADHRGDQTASIGLLVERWINKGGDNDIRFISDRVKVEALIHGNAVIDPRHSLHDRIWMNGDRESYRNPACVLLTYLVDDYFGLGLPLDAIDIDGFIELANYCDGRFTFDGYVDQSGDYAEILLDMATSFDGMIYIEDGLVKAKADKLSLPVCHVEESDCVGQFKLSNSNDSSYHNVVNVEFINTVANFTTDKFVLPTDVLTNPTILEDGFQKERDLKLPYTADNGSFERVKRIANKHLLKAKYQQSIELEVDNTRKNIKVLDVFEVSNKDYGLNRKQFRAIKVETSLDEKTTITKITAEQYEPSVYDESKYDDGITSPPVKPPTAKIPRPIDLKFTMGAFGLSGRGVLSWVTRYNREHRTVVEYKLASATQWRRAGESQLDSWNFDNLRADTYDFRVLTKSFSGSSSEWAELKGVVIKGGLSLPVVTGLKANFTSENLILSWDDMKPKKLDIPAGEVADVQTVADVFSHYEVVIYKGSAETYKETLTSASNGMVYTYNQNAATGADRRIRVDVRLVAVDGSEGNFAKVSATNKQTEQPSGVVVGGELTALSVRWDAPKDPDYAASEIHVGTVADFKPSISTLVEVSVNSSVVLHKNYEGIRYLKVGHYDKFGKDGIAYSDSFPFTMLTIDDLLDNSNSFDGVLGDIGNIDKEIEDFRNDVDKELEGVRTEVDKELGDLKTEIDGEIANIDKEIASVEGQVNQAKADIIKNATSITQANSTIAAQGVKIEDNKKAITSTQGNLASHQQSTTTEFNGVKSSINDNKTAIANTNKALTEHKTSVTAEFNGVKSSINENKTAITEANKALATYKTEVKAELDKANAAINTNKTSIATTDKALSDYKVTVKAELDKANAAIQTNQTAIADDKKALADYKTSVNAEFNGVKANIASNSTAIADDKKALADYKTSVAAELNGMKANITSNQTAIADDKKALADYKTVVKADFDKANAAINENKTAIADDKKALADYKTSVNAELNGMKANITSNQTAIADDKKALADYKVTVKADFDKANAAINTNKTSIADANKALSDYKLTVKAEFDKANAAINTNKTAIANDVKALADYKTAVTAELNGVKSSVTQNSQAIAGVDGKVNALHTIQLDSNGKVSGLIMANDGKTSTFDVIADKFRISSKAGDQAVFQVDAATGKTIMRTALIGDLTASNIKGGKITGDWISSNTKVVAGNGNAIAALDGSDGTWRIYAGNANPAAAPFRVNHAGALVASGASIQGHIDAASGVFRGDVYANNGVFNGTVNASGGTFNGTVNANAGTFNNVTISENCRVLGTLYADRIVGLPAGRNFTIPEVNIAPITGVGWRHVWQTNLVSAEGRFNIDCMLGGTPELKQVGDAWMQLRVLINGAVVHTTRVLTGQSGFNPIGELVGLPFRVGSGGGILTIEAYVPEHARGGFYFRMNTGYVYSAIANPAFWQ